MGDNMSIIQKGDLYLENISKEELIKLYNEEKNSKAKMRLLAACLRKQGKSLEDIGNSVQKSKSTIFDWLVKFQKQGLIGRFDNPRSGKPSKLNKTQLNELKLILSESPQKQQIPFTIWTSNLVQYIINKLYNVLFKIRRIEYLVKELGFTFQKPRQKNRRANTKKQEEFKKKFKMLFKKDLTMDSRSFVLTKHTL